jgi:O-antigen/teichoic acid export membrane protein
MTVENKTVSPFVNNIMWKMIDLISRKVFGFVISILLARLLLPEAYGTIALTIVFIAFTNIFILNGFNVALIRKEKIEPIDYSTVMVMSLVFVAFINIIVYFSAPAIAVFYESEDLCPVLRVMVFGLFFSAVSAVVSAKATRELKFKQMAIPSFCSNALGGIVAVVMAYMGFGVWALVFQTIIASLVLMIWYIVIFHFPLSLRFSTSVVKELYRFTLGVIGTSFLEFVGNHACSLVVGKTYGSKGLGYYDRSIVFPEMISANLSGAISNVLLPTLSQHQDDLNVVKEKTRKTMSFTMFIILPVMFGLIGCSSVFVPVLLTERWMPIIPMLCLFCVLYAILPIRTIEYSVLFALGKSKYSAQSEFLRAVLMVIGVLFVALICRAALVWVVFANTFVSLIVSIYIHCFVRKIINYSFTELLKDILPTLLISLFMTVVVAFVGSQFEATWLLLLTQVIIGFVLFVVPSFLFKTKNAQYMTGILHQYVSKYKKGNEENINHI